MTTQIKQNSVAEPSADETEKIVRMCVNEVCSRVTLTRMAQGDVEQIIADYFARHSAAKDREDRDWKRRFKAFHASLCRRFNAGHDEVDWDRDLCSLEEHIASQLASLREDKERLTREIQELKERLGEQ